jgi:hypothetical protein
VIRVEAIKREEWPRSQVLSFMLALALCGAGGYAETYLVQLASECALNYKARGEN